MACQKIRIWVALVGFLASVAPNQLFAALDPPRDTIVYTVITSPWAISIGMGESMSWVPEWEQWNRGPRGRIGVTYAYGDRWQFGANLTLTEYTWDVAPLSLGIQAQHNVPIVRALNGFLALQTGLHRTLSSGRFMQDEHLRGYVQGETGLQIEMPRMYLRPSIGYLIQHVYQHVDDGPINRRILDYKFRRMTWELTVGIRIAKVIRD